MFPLAKSATVIELLQTQERVQAELLRALGEWDADQSWAADGALSAASWIAAHAPVSKQRAHELMRAARLAHRHDYVGTKLAAGDMTCAHVETLARAATGRTRLLERDEELLVDIAPTLSVEDYATAMKHWRSAADDEMARADANLAFEERTVSFASTLDGRLELRASLDAEAGDIVTRALRLYDRPDRPPFRGGPVDGERTVTQRYADGLVQICSEALARHEAAGHPTAGIDGLIDIDRLGGVPAGLRGRCELSNAGPVARQVLDRVACDAAVGRVVMRGTSEVLDVGRRTRVVPRTLRRAVELRDGHCAFPGCDAPVHWCDVHHLVHWARGGATNLENCLLLCRRHHVLCHEGGWELARDPEGRVVVAVRGSRPRTRRRGPPDRYGLAA